MNGPTCRISPKPLSNWRLPRKSSGAFENLNFPGHAITELQLKAAVEKAVGRTLKLAHLPWRVLRLHGLFQPMMRELSRKCPTCVSSRTGLFLPGWKA